MEEYIPNERLAWSALSTGVHAYHAWLIIPVGSGCRVVTEETQRGFMCRGAAIFFPTRMYRYHQVWLEGLKRMAEQNTGSY